MAIMTNGVQRVIIAVKDLDKAVDIFRTLLGGQWHDLGVVHCGPSRAAWGVDVGIELISPIDDESPMAKRMRAMKCNAPGYPGGQGLLGIFFNVASLEKADAKVGALGLHGHRVSIPAPDSPKWDDPTSRLFTMPGIRQAMRAYGQTLYEEFSYRPEDCFGVMLGIGMFDSPIGPGVHRVVVLVRNENLDKLRHLYEELLGGRWYDQGIVDEGTARALWNFDAGLEVVAPLGPGHLADVMEQYGEGLLAVFFNVDDLEAAASRAKAVGLKEARRISIPGCQSPDWTDPASPFGKLPTLKKAVQDSKITRYDQIVFLPHPAIGMGFGICRFEMLA